MSLRCKFIMIWLAFQVSTEGRTPTVDGSEIFAPVDMVNIPVFEGVFRHLRWLFGISSINSIKKSNTESFLHEFFSLRAAS